MIGYHCTTTSKLEKYKRTGCILPPVRFWIFENSARMWLKKTCRDVLLKIEVDTSYPLPDHKPNGHGWWSPEHVRNYKIIT